MADKLYLDSFFVFKFATRTFRSSKSELIAVQVKFDMRYGKDGELIAG